MSTPVSDYIKDVRLHSREGAPLSVEVDVIEKLNRIIKGEIIVSPELTDQVRKTLQAVKRSESTIDKPAIDKFLKKLQSKVGAVFAA